MKEKGKVLRLFLLAMLLFSVVACSSKKEELVEKEESLDNEVEEKVIEKEKGVVGFGETELVYQFKLEGVLEELAKNFAKNDTLTINFGGITPLRNSGYLVMFGVGYNQGSGYAIVQLDKEGKVVRHDFFDGYCPDFYGCTEPGLAVFLQTVISGDRIIYFGSTYPSEPILMYDRNNGNKIGKINGDFSAIKSFSYISNGFVTDQYIFAFITQYQCCDHPITQKGMESYLLKINIETGKISWSALIRAGISKDALFDVYGIMPSTDENYFYVYGRLFENYAEIPGYEEVKNGYSGEEPFKLIIAKYNMDGYFQSKIIYRFDDYMIGGIREDSSKEKGDLLYVINYTNSCKRDEEETNPSCMFDMKTIITTLRADELFSVENVQEDLEFETFSEYDYWWATRFVYNNVAYIMNGTELLSFDLTNGDSARIQLSEYGVYLEGNNERRVLDYYLYEGELYYALIDGAGENIAIIHVPLGK